MLKIVPVESKDQLTAIRILFREYGESLGVDLSFQDFEKELAGLPGDYAPPGGRLYLAYENDREAGCVALRKISDEICEMKRLYVRPLDRGKGIGRDLARKIIGEARQIGYRRMRLDTMPSMKRALELYLTLGFRPIPPYRFNPVEGATFWELAL